MTQEFAFFLVVHHAACRISIPWPGIEPAPSALEAQSLNHWIARAVPEFAFLTSDLMILVWMSGITLCETMHYTDCWGIGVMGVFIQHFNFSEVVVSLKHPKKLWIQKKQHGILGRALNLVTSSEFKLWPCCWPALRPWESLSTFLSLSFPTKKWVQ